MVNPKSFRPWQPDQPTLLPPSPREWLDEVHLVYFLLDLVDELDLCPWRLQQVSAFELGMHA